MLNLWMFIAVELHLFHNIATVKKSNKGCKIWQGGVEYGKGCKILHPHVFYVGCKIWRYTGLKFFVNTTKPKTKVLAVLGQKLETKVSTLSLSPG